MTCPEPPSSLDGRCSAVYNNTLYVYTSSALLSLPLEQDAQWNTTSNGQPVTDPVCVTGSFDGSSNDQGLYVVGGLTKNSSYLGLQRYSFANKYWDSIDVSTIKLQNLVNHSAIYLPGTASILVFAGSSDSNQDASSTTFEYSIPNGGQLLSRAFNGLPSAIRPILLPWDNKTAVYVGGTPENTQVWLYHGMDGWNTSQVSLARGIPSAAGAAIQSNSDGSKFLEVFDLNVTPNEVSYMALLQTGGTPAFPGQNISFTSSSSTTPAKRDWGNTPPYNATLAPTTVRSSFSVAQSDNGLVVITSGNGTDSVAIFNQTQNSWVNTTKFFNIDQTIQGSQQPLTPSSSATAAATTTPASPLVPVSGGGTRISTGAIIGVTLGCLLAAAGVLILLLWLLRWLHSKRGGSAGIGGNGRYGRSRDKDRLSFQDQGIEPLTMAAVPMARSNGPSAVDSLNMLSGDFAKEYLGLSTTVKQNQPTTRPLVPPANGPFMTAATPRTDELFKEALMPTSDYSHSRGDRSTDEGWGKYFQDGNTKGLSTDSPRTTMNSDISQVTKSDYRGSMWPHDVPQTTTIALSALDSPRPFGQVPSGSPSTEYLPSSGVSHIHQAQAARISSADSASFISDMEYDHDHQDAFSTTDGQSHPDASSSVQQRWNLRAPSSNYTDSFYQSNTREPSTIQESTFESRSHDRRSSGILRGDPNRKSRNNVNSDMSWLNLHAD